MRVTVRIMTRSGQSGSFSLDLDRLSLHTSSGEISLRPKSFEVLRYLVEHRGRVVTKEEVLSAVWSDVTVTEESLTRCISEIRQAIGDEDRRIIKTISKKGYVLDAAGSTFPATKGPARAERVAPALSLPDRPSIAVLPFANLSADPQQDYFADGIVEDIITELSKFGELFVIARNSSFQYKGKAVDIREVGRELGVHYVLEGSVRRGSDRIRIAAQLIDAITGVHRWAERYDLEPQDIFSVQDEVVQTIVAILVAHLSKAEGERTMAKPAARWEAYDFCMRAGAIALQYLSSLNPLELLETRRLANEALAIDPNYARAHTILSFTFLTAWYAGFDSDFLSPVALDRAYRSVSRAVQLDPYSPQAHAQLTLVLTYKREHDASVEALERANELNPNFVDWRFSAALTFAGEAVRAIEIGRAYMRRDPFYPAFATAYLGLAHYVAKDYGEAARLLRQCVSRSPSSRPGHIWLAATYAQLGQLEQARVHAAKVLQILPGYTIDASAKMLAAYRYESDAHHYFEGLRKAGLPEN